MLHRLIMLLTGLLLTWTVLAATDAPVPADFMFGGKPIDPRCFYSYDTERGVIELGHCGAKMEKLIRSGKNQELIKRGFFGYNFEDISEDKQGYSYYKLFPANNNEYWVYTLNQGAGEGVFSALLLVKRSSDSTLRVRSVALGDRCNGGLVAVMPSNHQMSYRVSLTPYDLMLLADKDAQSHTNFGNLASCATCCVGKADYSVDDQAKSTLVSIELDEIKSPATSCFDKVAHEYVQQGKSHLGGEALDSFVKRIEQCQAVE